VADPAGLTGLGLDPARLVLLVHSGSRGLGQAILNTHLAAHSASGLPAEGPTGQAYLARHDQAVAWAGTNRALIASRFLTALGSAPPRSPTLDLCHNSVSPYVHDDTTGWLHRKGAAPADAGPVVIAGSRGTLSYLVAPTSDQTANLATLAHGAGRKWRRSEARERLVRRYTPESLSRTSLGGRVICQDRDLIYEEAPQAYKNIDQVIDDLVGAGLVTVIATLSPLLTYKTRASRS
jgi:release factor H-coupled RctB family protein